MSTNTKINNSSKDKISNIPDKKKPFYKPNSAILKVHNYVFYQILFVFYKFIKLFIYPFQRIFITTYTVLLHLNLLPFNFLINSAQRLFIYICDIELWCLIFKRIKNHINVYIIREQKHPITHRFWVLYYREENKYYYELNVKNQSNDEISNFFYSTRIGVKKNSAPKDLFKPHNSFFLYYFNKLCLSNHPYFYWTYDLVYNKYGLNPLNSDESSHVRTHLMFLFFKKLQDFVRSKNKRSFVKATFKTFRGVKNYFLFVKKRKKVTFVKKRPLSKQKVKYPIEGVEKHFFITKLKKTLPFFNKTTTSILFKTQHASLLKLFNIWVLQKTPKLVVKPILLDRIKNTLKLEWYSKIHNSVVNLQKNQLILYLRSSRHFNKGRYSRNRQLYRTGVYWCIWLNVIIVYGLYFYFYRFVFSFGYLWFPLGLLLLSMFSSRLYKYRYYNIVNIKTEFEDFNNFLFLLYLKIKISLRPALLYFNVTGVKFIKNYTYLLYSFIWGKIYGVLSVFIIAFKKTPKSQDDSNELK